MKGSECAQILPEAYQEISQLSWNHPLMFPIMCLFLISLFSTYVSKKCLNLRFSLFCCHKNFMKLLPCWNVDFEVTWTCFQHMVTHTWPQKKLSLISFEDCFSKLCFCISRGKPSFPRIRVLEGKRPGVGGCVVLGILCPVHMCIPGFHPQYQ